MGLEVLRYHKIHPFSYAGEHEHYAGGEALLSAEVEGVRVTPVICYDLRFPELFRAAADRTDLFVVIANWPEKRAHAWRTLLLARAIENLAFVLGVNRVGTGGGEPHSGDSALVDPYGRLVAGAALAPGRPPRRGGPRARPEGARGHGLPPRPPRRPLPAPLIRAAPPPAGLW